MSIKTINKIIGNNENFYNNTIPWQGALGKLTRFTFHTFCKNPHTFMDYMDKYLTNPKNGIPMNREARSQTKANRLREFERRHVTWKVLCKALRFFDFKEVIFVIKATHKDDKITEHVAKIKFRELDDNGEAILEKGKKKSEVIVKHLEGGINCIQDNHVLSCMLKEMVDSAYLSYDIFKASMNEYFDDPVNALPKNEADRSSIRSSLLKEFKKPDISWKVFWKGIRVLRIKVVILELRIDAGRRGQYNLSTKIIEDKSQAKNEPIAL